MKPRMSDSPSELHRAERGTTTLVARGERSNLAIGPFNEEHNRSRLKVNMLHCTKTEKPRSLASMMRAESEMPESLPIVLIPGLNCSPRLYAPQISGLWRFGPVSIANHARDDTMAAIAKRILDDAPARFALAGLSMGGYIALEIMRQASSRVTKLALLDTGARDDPPEAQERRRKSIAATEAGRFDEIIDLQLP